MSPGVAGLGHAGFAAGENVTQCCRGLTEGTGRIFSKPLVIVGGSDDEADLASSHLPEILPCQQCSRFSQLVHWPCLDSATAVAHLSASSCCRT